jgi:hypothetical protein
MNRLTWSGTPTEIERLVVARERLLLRAWNDYFTSVD